TEELGPEEKVALPVPIESIADPHEGVRRQAASAQGAMEKRGRVARAALRLACEDADGQVRVVAALALRRVGGSRSETTQTLEDVLQRGQGEARVEAALTLWQLDRRHDVIPPLVGLLREEGEAR